jgi:hypothetical protein
VDLDSARRRLTYSRLAWALRRDHRPWATVGRPGPGGGRQPVFGLVATYNEDDVVGETVRSLFEQGCERVLLVDNDSTDGSVAAATDAGAEHVASFRLPTYSEAARIAIMNAVVRAEVATAGLPAAWWVWSDADELVTAPDGRDLATWLADVPATADVVAAHVLEHYPAPGAPEYGPGVPLLEAFPLAVWNADGPCRLRHRKHPIHRQRAGGPFVAAENGFHRATADRLLVEHRHAVVQHHFPFRSEARTRERLGALLADRNAGYEAEIGKASNYRRRMQQAADVYGHRWDALGLAEPPRPWRDVVADAVAAEGR